MAIERQVLGRGLDQLLGRTESSPVASSAPLENRVLQMDVEKIQRDPKQPRQFFDDKSLEELAQSIKEQGLIQPIIVSKKDEKSYIIVAGERRWRAIQRLGWSRVPVILKNDEGKLVKRMTLALVENLQRENLNPLEEAKAFEWLLKEKNWTQQNLADKIGRDRSSITNTLRLLNLHPEAQDLLKKNKISLSIAKVVLQEKDLEKQKIIARMASQQNMTVREVEKYLKKQNSKDRNKERKQNLAPLWLELGCEKLSQKWKIPVSVNVGSRKMILNLTFLNSEQLKEFLNDV